jgi:anti-sigma factor ChrR (cupin superfamily)
MRTVRVARGHSIGLKEQRMVGEQKDRVPGRRSLRLGERRFLPYDLEGPGQPEMEWLPISYDRATGQGSYLMRMAPGAVTIPHDHPGLEEFMILEGELTDSDGTVYRAGDFVSYQPGTHHNSWTGPGCVIVVFEWASPAQQGQRPAGSAGATARPGGR